MKKSIKIRRIRMLKLKEQLLGGMAIKKDLKSHWLNICWAKKSFFIFKLSLSGTLEGNVHQNSRNNNVELEGTASGRNCIMNLNK